MFLSTYVFKVRMCFLLMGITELVLVSNKSTSLFKHYKMCTFVYIILKVSN